MRRRWTELSLVIALALSAASLLALASSQGTPDAKAAAQKDYDSTIIRADALVAAGDYFEAVRQYERAGRVAYNNKLTIDKAALDAKLTEARKLRDTGKSAPAGAPVNPKPGGTAPGAAGTSFIELTTPLATGPRTVTSKTVPDGGTFGPGDESRWIVSNPYLPADRKFFEKINHIACAADGSLYVAGGSLVGATDSRRPPIANKSFYAANGTGIWRVAPDGAITAFAVHPSINQPGADHVTARCNVSVADAAVYPDNWGGMAIDGSGNLFVSDSEHNLILKFTKDGRVERVAGGGPQACVYDRYKDPQQSGFLDGPSARALFKEPAGLAFDRSGNLLVADMGNEALRRIDSNGDVSTLRKGFKPDVRGPNEGNAGISYQFVAIDRTGLPVVGGARFSYMEQYGYVYRITADGRSERLLAGRRFRFETKQQELGYLGGIAVSPDGTLLVSDSNADMGRVYEVREGRLVAVTGVGGENMLSADVDGPASKAILFKPSEICTVPDGSIFVMPDKGGRPLRKLDAKTRTVSTWVY